jgi:hypothetical protein
VTCEEFQARLAELALPSLEPGAQAELMAHLAEAGPHAGCAEALARARRAAQAPGLALDPAPVPAGLWEKVEARLAGSAPARPPPRRFAGGLALAAALLAAVAALALWQRAAGETEAAQREVGRLREAAQQAQRQRIDLEERVVTAQQSCARNVEALKSLALDDRAVALLERSGTRVVSFAPQPKHPELKAVAVFNPETGEALVLSNGLPALAGHDYQLWTIRGKGAPQPAGLLHPGGAGAVVAQLTAAAFGATAPDALAISIEPLGGSATPTEVAMVAGLHS